MKTTKIALQDVLTFAFLLARKSTLLSMRLLMNQLNSIIIEGNVTRAPELKEPNESLKVCEIPLAVNRFYRNSEGEGIKEVSYFNVEAYGKMAERAVQECVKGRGLRVVGRLRQNRWTTAEGKKTSKVTIIAEHIEFKPKPIKSDSDENLSAITEANQAAYEEELNLEEKEVAVEETVF